MQRLQPGQWGREFRFPKDFPASPQACLFLSRLNVFIYVARSGAREGLRETLSGYSARTIGADLQNIEVQHPLFFIHLQTPSEKVWLLLTPPQVESK